MQRAAALLAVLALLCPAARASQQGQQVILKWKGMDGCARQAQLAYPDATAEAGAKREAKFKECLNAAGLPPRGPALPEPAAKQ